MNVTATEFIQIQSVRILEKKAERTDCVLFVEAPRSKKARLRIAGQVRERARKDGYTVDERPGSDGWFIHRL